MKNSPTKETIEDGGMWKILTEAQVKKVTEAQVKKIIKKEEPTALDDEKLTPYGLPFSSHIASMDQTQMLKAISEEASKLASVIAYRIENPRPRLAKGENPKTIAKPSKKVEKLPFHKATLKQRNESVHARQKYQLTLWDKQEVFQEVNAFLFRYAPNGEKLNYAQISQLFSNCRKVLEMNGGNHDVTHGDELDEAAHYVKIGSLESLVKGSVERFELASKLKNLRAKLMQGFCKDTSREKKANYKRHAMTIIRIAAHCNPDTRLTCPPIDPKRTDTAHESELGKRFSSFRKYAGLLCPDIEKIKSGIANAWQENEKNFPKLLRASDYIRDEFHHLVLKSEGENAVAKLEKPALVISDYAKALLARA